MLQHIFCLHYHVRELNGVEINEKADGGRAGARVTRGCFYTPRIPCFFKTFTEQVSHTEVQ